MITKLSSIKVSERVFDYVDEMIDGTDGITSAQLETFNNCREQGFCLSVVTAGCNHLRLWAFEDRNSDNIVVICGTLENCNTNCMFNATAYDKREYFAYNQERQAAQYIVDYIKEATK